MEPRSFIAKEHLGRQTDEEIKTTIADYEARYERPTTDVLKDGCGKLVDTICRLLA